MNPLILGLVFLFITLSGFYAAYLYGHRTRKFSWSGYIAIIIWPVLVTFILAYYIGIKILILFCVTAILGFILEYIVGMTYHKTLNKRLWTYDKFSLNGYTSWLSIPVWGIGGIIFYFIVQIVMK